jgi:two-component system NtrC family response regulator
MSRAIKILMVDDEVKFLEAIATRLELRGFEVTAAANGEDALTIADSKKFDLALVDLKMPGLNGQQVLEALKERHKHLEVIILTGHGSLQSAVDCTKLGAFGYLPKPYEFEKLVETLKQAYEARLRKKFEADAARMEKISEIATGQSALGILRALRELDDEEK